MRHGFLVFVAAGLLSACGGTVTQEKGTGESSGTGAQAGGGNAGTAGTAGTAGVGGTAGFGGASGFGGTAGFGGAAGTAGMGGMAGAGGAPYCCSGDFDCPQWMDDPAKTTECVNGVCKEIPPYMQCWRDADCPFGACMGASVCPCGAACDSIDQLGWCAAPPPPPGCCKNDMQCGDYMYVPCVSGVCKQTVAGKCWKNEECPYPQKCVGASVCPCGMDCGIADMPGICQ